MMKLALKLMVALLGFTGAHAIAQESPWVVRARAVHIDTADKSVDQRRCEESADSQRRVYLGRPRQ